MTATDRTPTTRILTLAAIIIAAGVLSIRAFDLFGSIQSEPVGNSTERELTYLLEPIAGEGEVRVTISGRETKSILIMLNGEVGTDLRAKRLQIENVLIASIGYVPEKDTLTLTQFPFARGIGGTLTPLQMAEFTSLGLLCILLIGSLVIPVRSKPLEHAAPALPRPEPTLRRTDRSETPRKALPSSLQTASTLAEAQPDKTANLVRDWMSYSEES